MQDKIAVATRINELLTADDSHRPGRGEILARVERGEITAKEAAELLKGR